MKFKIKENKHKFKDIDCFIVPVFFKKFNDLFFEKISKKNYKKIDFFKKIEKIEGKYGKYVLIRNKEKTYANRILIMGFGEKKLIDKKKIYNIFHKIFTIITKQTRSINCLFFLEKLCNCSHEIYWYTRTIIKSIADISYNFSKFKKKKEKKNLKKIFFYVKTLSLKNIVKKSIFHEMCIQKGIVSSKNISNMPPNICTPAYLSHKSTRLEKKYSGLIETNIIKHKEIKKLKMNAYLSVAKGSKRKPIISVIKYNGKNNKNFLKGRKTRNIVLIGKGVTFDSGGISLKPSRNMDEMKFDMCGAAAVYGVMIALAELKLPISVVGLLVACENLPSHNSLLPGEIIKTMSGKTIEVLDTDAEGRLLLSDALTFSKKFNPEIVIDIATLTGACVVALGNVATGLMSNDEKLSKKLIDASIRSMDLAWKLPLLQEYKDMIRSNIADIANISNTGEAGAITAACFLSHFSKSFKWAHLDIAGTAWKRGKNKSATGRPISLLVQFFLDMIKDFSFL